MTMTDRLAGPADALAGLAQARQSAVAALLTQVRQCVGQTTHPSREVLHRIGEWMAALARRRELFPDAHFPEPRGAEIETLYLLGESPSGEYALYVWRPAPAWPRLCTTTPRGRLWRALRQKSRTRSGAAWTTLRSRAVARLSRLHDRAADLVNTSPSVRMTSTACASMESTPSSTCTCTVAV